ncbi:hypothetical protein ACU4GD_03145 [Cupriavidus basilensis]
MTNKQEREERAAAIRAGAVSCARAQDWAAWRFGAGALAAEIAPATARAEALTVPPWTREAPGEPVPWQRLRPARRVREERDPARPGAAADARRQLFDDAAAGPARHHHAHGTGIRAPPRRHPADRSGPAPAGRAWAGGSSAHLHHGRPAVRLPSVSRIHFLECSATPGANGARQAPRRYRSATACCRAANGPACRSQSCWKRLARVRKRPGCWRRAPIPRR